MKMEMKKTERIELNDSLLGDVIGGFDIGMLDFLGRAINQQIKPGKKDTGMMPMGQMPEGYYGDL